MTAMDSIKAKFDEYEYLLRAATEKIEELAAENERSLVAPMRCLKMVEVNKLTPVPPPLELTAEVIPLRQLVDQRRARAERFWEPGGVSNGNADGTDSDGGNE